jgi:hypothetical protein
VIAYQEILSKAQAENFEESLHTLIEHLETRQHQLARELQEVTTTLQVFSRMSSGNLDEGIESSIVVDAIAHLESINRPQLETVEEPVSTSSNGAATVAAPTTSSTPEKAASTKGAKKAGSSTKKAAEPKASSASSATVESGSFHPRRSVLKEFQGKTLSDTLKLILKRQVGKPLSLDEIMVTLYGKSISEKSAEIARPVVVHELSKGKGKGYWTSVTGRRGYYLIKG